MPESQVSYAKALEVFEDFDAALKAPSLHPDYVILDAVRDQELRPVFFVYEEEGSRYYHGFHLAQVKGTGFYDIQSPYGYGGPIASSDDPSFLARAWKAYLAWCRGHNVLVEFIRFHPLLENWHYYGGEAIDDRPTVWIDLRMPDLLSTFNTRVRTAIRKATKSGLRVEWVDGVLFMDIFPRMYEKAMTELKVADLYYFRDDYFEHLRDWGKTRFALCLGDNEVQAAAIFLAEGNIMEYHLSASTPSGRKLAATNLILYGASLAGSQLGYHMLHLGGGSDSTSANPLLFFKAGYSSYRGVFRIGRKIHQQEAYDAFKVDWLKQHSDAPGRILFYRR